MKNSINQKINRFFKANLFMVVFLISALAALVVSSITIINMNGTVTNMKSAKGKLDTAEDLLIENYRYRLWASAEAAQHLLTLADFDMLRIRPGSPDSHNAWFENGDFLNLRNQLINFGNKHGLKYVYCYFRIDNFVLPLIDNDPVLTQAFTPASEPIEIDNEAKNAWNDKEITVTAIKSYSEYDDLITAYTPILDQDGNVIALIGVDIKGEQLLSLREEINSISNQTELFRERINYLIIFMVITLILLLTGGVLTFAANKKRAVALQHALKQEEAANRAKSGFLSTMSHEIRTPMNAILGITEIQLQNNHLDEGVRESLEKIYTSGDMLLGIINDILDLSKIEAGKLELTEGKYEIASLISDTAQLNMMRIGSKPIEFEINVDENLPALLTGDELRVKQILNNILSNAFKYTAAGVVKLSVTMGEDNGNDKVTLVIAVSDTGQGMTKEQVDKLFDEYSRFNMDANRTTEGTGLGMSITRNLIRLMNGEISIESEPNKGSVFTVYLPQDRIGSDVLGKEMAENLHQFRTSSRSQMKRVQINREPMPYGNILIVDDVGTNIYVAQGLMAPYELKIDSADSGFAAIEKIKDNNVYDIIFMDHMMPKMDGVETTKRIRDMGYKHPIVALTANAVAGQAEVFLGNGFDDFISKPIDIRQLNTVLNKLIRDKQPPEILEAAKRQADTREEQEMDTVSKPAVNPRFAEIFARDANKALAILEKICETEAYDNEENMRTYIINVHGMKSALANIGNMPLSAAASKLEAAARERNIEIITSETPVFLESLRVYADELTPKKESGDDAADEDKEFLGEKLHVIIAACDEYDENTADMALSELRGKTWSQPTNDLLGTIAEHLLHSDFDEIVEIIRKF